jgi:hypothetical protein
MHPLFEAPISAIPLQHERSAVNRLPWIGCGDPLFTDPTNYSDSRKTTAKAEGDSIDEQRTV